MPVSYLPSDRMRDPLGIKSDSWVQIGSLSTKEEKDQMGEKGSQSLKLATNRRSIYLGTFIYMLSMYVKYVYVMG